jgi:hypothetical protein
MRTSDETISGPRLHDKGPGDDLRHTFATWLEDAAIPSRVIDELMGHASGHRDPGAGGAGGSPMGRVYRETTPAMVARVTAALDETNGCVLGCERLARRWHARGQGFKSPQLHPRSKALSAADRPPIPALAQQIRSNRQGAANPRPSSALFSRQTRSKRHRAL